MAFSGFCAPARRGATCRSDTATGTQSSCGSPAPTRCYASTNRRGRRATYPAVCGKWATLSGNVDRANRKPQCGRNRTNGWNVKWPSIRARRYWIDGRRIRAAPKAPQRKRPCRSRALSVDPSRCPEPKLDAPPNVRREYEEASQTLEASPRGAAALLRLAIEKLCKELGVSGESLKDDIAFFVREDVDARVQKVLDAARIIESNAVRPGQIGLGDDPATAETLSGLVNLICEKMIMEPRHLQAVYTKLREGARTAMEQRAQGSS
jgi:Domain of unknown function (DUF4145)